MNNVPRPTIRSLAAALSISPTTVSEALRNHPRVNAHTRERVQSAARAAGYRFNPLASSMMSEVRRTRLAAFHGVLAAVNLVEPERPVFPGPFLRDLLGGAEERAAEFGFKLESFSVGRQLTVHRLDQVLQSRGIRGVVILPAWKQPNFAQLSWKDYSGVYADYLMEQPALHSVCPDHHQAMCVALTHLAELGYRRPGLVLQHHHAHRLQHRWTGAFLASREYTFHFDAVSPLVLPNIDRAAFQEWFRREKPDVVLAHRPETIVWMQECGARIPESHGFCCLNLALINEACAGLDLQPRLIGECAVDLVVGQLHRNAYGIPANPYNTTVSGRWVDGPTVAARAAIA